MTMIWSWDQSQDHIMVSWDGSHDYNMVIGRVPRPYYGHGTGPKTVIWSWDPAPWAICHLKWRVAISGHAGPSALAETNEKLPYPEILDIRKFIHVYPKFWISGFPDIRISGNPEIRVAGTWALAVGPGP